MLGKHIVQAPDTNKRFTHIFMEEKQHNHSDEFLFHKTVNEDFPEFACAYFTVCGFYLLQYKHTKSK